MIVCVDVSGVKRLNEYDEAKKETKNDISK